MSEPYYEDDWLTVYHADATAVLATLPAESVHCVVTSPPYWGLRDYGTASWSGGDTDCDHAPRHWDGPKQTQGAQSGHAARADRLTATACRCGAVREDGQLGLEATPEAYVAAMVAVFREVRRVLRKDGTVWLNLGDSYASIGRSGRKESPGVGAKQEMDRVEREVVWSPRDEGDPDAHFRWSLPGGIKPKDLVGIPWRVAFALQADGWYLRSDIIWAKPNPMPESVTDRPTKAHEYVFLLSRSPRYYFDADAVREPSEPWAANHPDSWATGLGGGHDTVRWSQRQPGPVTAGSGEMRSGRNVRSVWTIATQPYPGAHFAVFPEALVEPCVKAGTSERGVCPECGAPWQRIVEREKPPDFGRGTNPKTGSRYNNTDIRNGNGGLHPVPPLTTGWRPSCGHDSEPVPGVVLDMFAGSGTVGLVAQRLSRRAVLIDLSMDYLGQLMDRNRDIPLGLGA